MGYRFDYHYKFCIRTNQSAEAVFEMLTDMPVDQTIKVAIDYFMPDTGAEKGMTITYIKIDYGTFYAQQWVSPIHDWVMALIKSKEFTIENHDAYALFQYNMDDAGSHFGVQSYSLIMQADDSDKYRQEQREEEQRARALRGPKHGSIAEQIRAIAKEQATSEV